jgi:hypothetical protein
MHSETQRSNSPLTPAVRLFSPALRAWWCAIFVLTVVLEVAPYPLVPPKIFYSYLAFRALLFVSLGFLTPLALWRFDSVGFGLLFSTVAAGAAELLQSLSEGHASSFVEFGAKLILMLIGFTLALNTRHNGMLRLGPIQVHFINTHQRKTGTD